MPPYLVTADPVASLQPRFDTTIRVLAELLGRGVPVDYCDLAATDLSRPPADWLAALPVHAVEYADPSRTPCIGLAAPRLADAAAYELLLHRKDPPVDAAYRAWTSRFAALAGPVQVNDPAELLRRSEHTLAAEAFPELAVPTVHCRDLAALEVAVRTQPTEAVVKPLYACSGVGIAFFAADAPLAALQDHWDMYAGTGPEGQPDGLVVQPYQPAIVDRGDLRILVMAGRVLGCVTRVPRPGSRLANLHQGAGFRAAEPTPRQLAAVDAIAGELTPRGLWLLGIDFIGDLVSEINFTSPSALVQIDEVMHRRVEVDLVDELERLRARAR